MKIKSIRAIVTGGTSGLGKTCITELLKHGALCASFDTKETVICDSKIVLNKNLFFYKTDVSNEDNVHKSVANAIAALKSVNVLINCAGIGYPAKIIGNDNSKKNNFMAIFNKTIKVNLIGTMNIIQTVAEKMLDNSPNKDGEKGIIINTSSIAAFEGQIGQAAYSASKAGLIGLMLPLAREFANYGIRIVTISPGLFDTPMFSNLPEKTKRTLINSIPFPKRLAQPVEFAQLVACIIENPILNAETIRIDSAIRM